MNPAPSQQMSIANNRHILFGLMCPSMLMPMISAMSRVALPIVRDDFALQADVVAWIDVGFSLPFMLLMPVYGRLGDGLGPRRLLILGIALFALGSAAVITATDLTSLLFGRALQGFGLSGMMPLSMALITATFPAEIRGRAMGTWSTIGPATAFFGPLLAGVLVANWGWRWAFAPSLLFGLLALVAVYMTIPKPVGKIDIGFLREFDWGGVALLAPGMSLLIFFLSSRPITGVEPLEDWRLLLAAALFLTAFVSWEKRCRSPFMPLDLFANGAFLRSSFCASMRMVVMAAITFLIPLYLVDVQKMRPTELGGMLMIGAGAMTLIVRVAGALSDSCSSRWLVVAGLSVQMGVMLAFWQLPGNASLWSIGLTLGAHGLGAGLMLATLHKSVMGNVEQSDTGAAAGLYGMFRFGGATTGTALCGVFLQMQLDSGAAVLASYQQVFLLMAIFPFLGILVAFTLRDQRSA
ncbi:MAG TPA: MFS transporter [Candidatus Handelsmanbacteria bacterium]|nr:MFS transporter [Candidatus Handelsmanbacteria bacterium]